MSDAESVWIVGAGCVARTFASALQQSEVPVVGLWARRPNAAQRAGVESNVASYSGELPAAFSDASIVVLAVSDDAIAEVARKLWQEGALKEHQVVLHCSGASSATSLLASIAGRVRGVGTLHPLRALRNSVVAAQSMAGTTFGIEGNAAGARAALHLCEALSGRPLHLQAEQMVRYHAVAVMASNYLVTLLGACQSMLNTAGIDAHSAMPALCDLAQGAIENVRTEGIPDALTGPIRRGDLHTVETHLHAIADHHDELLEMYRVLGRYTAEIALTCEAGDSEKTVEIIELLKAFSKPSTS